MGWTPNTTTKSISASSPLTRTRPRIVFQVVNTAQVAHGDVVHHDFAGEFVNDILVGRKKQFDLFPIFGFVVLDPEYTRESFFSASSRKAQYRRQAERPIPNDPAAALTGSASDRFP